MLRQAMRVGRARTAAVNSDVYITMMRKGVRNDGGVRVQARLRVLRGSYAQRAARRCVRECYPN